jgi:hypothetical protein
MVAGWLEGSWSSGAHGSSNMGPGASAPGAGPDSRIGDGVSGGPGRLPRRMASGFLGVFMSFLAVASRTSVGAVGVGHFLCWSEMGHWPLVHGAVARGSRAVVRGCCPARLRVRRPLVWLGLAEPFGDYRCERFSCYQLDVAFDGVGKACFSHQEQVRSAAQRALASSSWASLGPHEPTMTAIQRSILVAMLKVALG